MKERQILFSGPMVRAILEGRKTQTRRVVTDVLGIGRIHDFGRSDTVGYQWQMRDRRGLWNELRTDGLVERCPYGQPGGRLWVRETFKEIASGEVKNGYGEVRYGFAYQADAATRWNARPTIIHDLTGQPATGPMQFQPRPWKPSIHMPRRACRLLLEITDVCVERLQDISRSDAAAEGVETWAEGALSPDGQLEDPRVQFAMLWESINGADSWASNPWVWAITFKRVIGT